MTRREVLLATRFGERIAEEEGSELNAYFVETDPWRRIYGGEVDVVFCFIYCICFVCMVSCDIRN